MLKKTMVWAILIFLCVSMLAGCGASKTTETDPTPQTTAEQTPSPTPEPQKEPANLVFLNGSIEMVDFWTAYFEKYNADNKDIQVEHQFQKEATKALQVMMASGSTPDIMLCDATQDMIDNKKFVDLTDEAWWSQLNPAVKEFCTDVKSGRAYSIATMQGAVGIYYNKTIFTELGLKPANTWSEFVSNLKAIKEKKPDLVPFYMGGKDVWMLSHLAEYTFQAVAKQRLSYKDQQTAMLGNDLAKLGWDATPEGALSVMAKNFMDLKKDGLINSNIVTATYDNQTTEFATGKAAVISQGIWAAGDIQKKNADTSFVGFCQYPALLEGVKPAIGSGVDGKLFISSESKYVDAAKQVVGDILNIENMKAISETRKAPSANPSVQSDWGYLKDEVGKVLSDASVASVTWTSYPSGFSGDDSGRIIQEMFAGKYKESTEFAQAWLDAWTKGFGQ